MKDLPFVLNLYEAKKMKLLYEVIFNLYHISSPFAQVAGGRGDVLVVGNHSKDIDT